MDQKDMLIWVTGTVGRAMGSGQFTDPNAIAALTQEALAAFDAHIAPRLAQTPTAPSHAPSASQRPSAPYAAPPPQNGGGVAAEAANVNRWGGDKAYLGQKDWEFEGRPMHDITWGEWLMAASEKNEAALKQLRYTASQPPGDKPQWRDKNIQKSNRAKACLDLAKRQQESAQPPY